MKKVFLLALPVLLLAAAFGSYYLTGGYIGSYSDITGHWAYESIERWSEKGVLSGSDGKFRPDDGLTLAELATVLTRVLPLEERAENTFADVEAGVWFEDAVLRCVAAGILDATASELHPRDVLSRADGFVMLSRACSIAPAQELSELAGFNDAKRVPEAAKPYLAAMLHLGVIQGTSAVQLDPREALTRAETAAVLDRLCELGYIQDGTQE